MKILFLHGWQSVPGGVKPTYLAQHGHEVVNPALPDEDFDVAVQIAQAEFDKHQPACRRRLVTGRCRGDEPRQRRHPARAALPGLEEVRDCSRR